MDQHKNQGNGGNKRSKTKVRLIVSYGGKIQSKAHNHQLFYGGGDTKILTVDHKIKYLDIVGKLNSLLNLNTHEYQLKYQLPGEDLDSLISVINDDDVENMMFEYDRIPKSARLRLFLFPLNQCAAPRAELNPDFLFGFDKEFDPNSTPDFEIPSLLNDGDSGSGQESKQVIETEKKIERITEAKSCDTDNNGPPSYVYTAQAPLIYWLPVTAGTYQPRTAAGSDMGNQKQPAYSFLPVIPCLPY